MDTNRLPNQALNYKPKLPEICTENVHIETTKTCIKYKPKLATKYTEDGHYQTTKTNTIKLNKNG